MTKKKAVAIGVDAQLDLETVLRVARPSEDDGVEVTLTAPAREAIRASAEWVTSTVAELSLSTPESPARPFYGINTGFGSLAGRTALDSEYLTKVLTRNLLTSHSSGVREYFDEETVRAALLLRAHSLAQGHSGVRVEIVEKLTDMLNAHVYPAVPCMGSLGASGDLAPLSHLALLLSKPPRPSASDEERPTDPCSGEAFLPAPKGEAIPDSFLHLTEERPSGRQRLWKRVSGRDAMRAVGGPLELRAKEGLALNNGTTFSCASAALTLSDALNVLENAELSLSLTLEALKGFRDPFFEEVHRLRRHPGAQESASRVRSYCEGSSLLDGSREEPPQRIPPQDPYSVRCAPQVHGAVRDTLQFVRGTVETELNAVTDNPLIFLDLPRLYKTVSGGNFHGEPLALAMDYLGIAVSELGNVAERRIFKLTDYKTEEDGVGLPPFLVADTADLGLHSGLMIPQYTAASLISECKTLAHPDSVDSIPSSASQEDHVSMSLNAALHARRIVDNIEHVVAIEFLCACQGLEWRLRRQPHLNPGRGTSAAFELFRRDVPYLEHDRALYPYLRAALKLVRSGRLIEAARQASLG